MASLSGNEQPVSNSVWLRTYGYRTFVLTRMLAAALVLILLPRLGEADETTLIGQVTLTQWSELLRGNGAFLHILKISRNENLGGDHRSWSPAKNGGG